MRWEVFRKYSLLLLWTIFLIGCSQREESAKTQPETEDRHVSTTNKNGRNGTDDAVVKTEVTTDTGEHKSTPQDAKIQQSKTQTDSTEPKIQFESLKALPPPISNKPVPKVKVRKLGSREPPVKGTIYAAFTDQDGRLKYLVTKKHINILNRKGKIWKKINRKSRPVYNKTGTGVGFSVDGRFFWQSFIPVGAPEEGEQEWLAETEVYDDTGKIQWVVPGIVDSLSPDGNSATLSLPEASGIQFMDRFWNEPRDLRSSIGEVYRNDSCVFEKNIIGVFSKPDPCELVVFDKNLEIIQTKRLAADCKVDVCLGYLDRVIIDCSDSRNKQSALYVLDSAGREIAKSWMPYFGNRVYDLNVQDNMVAIGVSAGEMMLINFINGEIIARTRRIGNLPEPLPPQHTVDKQTWLVKRTGFKREIIGKYLIRQIVLLGNAIGRLREPYRIIKAKERIFDIIDLSGNILFSKRFVVDELLPYIKLPAIWREDNTAIVSIKGKVEIFIIEKENK